MSESLSFQQPAVQEVEYARELQLRLYREIGVSAVAAALEVSLDAVAEPVTLTRPIIAAEIREHAKAA